MRRLQGYGRTEERDDWKSYRETEQDGEMAKQNKKGKGKEGKED